MKTKQYSKGEIHPLHHITPGNLPLRRQRILAQHLESMTLLVRLLHCLGEFLLPRTETFLHAQDQQTYLFHLRHRCFHAHLCAWATVARGWRRNVLHRGRKERCGGTWAEWAGNGGRCKIEVSLRGKWSRRSVSELRQRE